MVQSADPRDDPRPHPDLPRPLGGDRLVRLGGEGTPRVRELMLCELGIARGVHTLAARAVAADVLDLRHRLPQTWTEFLTGRCDAWLARRVASLSRKLSAAAVALVDAAAAAAIGSESSGRVLAIVEAKIIEADLAGHEAEVQAARQRRFVSLSRVEHGLRYVIARVTTGDAAYVDAVIARVATSSPPAPNTPTPPATSSGPPRSGGWPAPPNCWPCSSNTPRIHEKCWTNPWPAPAYRLTVTSTPASRSRRP